MLYKQTFGALLIGGALVYAFFTVDLGAKDTDCAYSLFRFSVRKMIPLVKNKMNLDSTQIKILNQLDDILQNGAKTTRDTRMEIMQMTSEGIQNDNFNIKAIYQKSAAKDDYTKELTKKALEKMDRFVSSLNPAQKRFLVEKLNSFRKECRI